MSSGERRSVPGQPWVKENLCGVSAVTRGKQGLSFRPAGDTARHCSKPAHAQQNVCKTGGKIRVKTDVSVPLSAKGAGSGHPLMG